MGTPSPLAQEPEAASVKLAGRHDKLRSGRSECERPMGPASAVIRASGTSGESGLG